ncbi:hypothetical protein HY251_07955, partial [bacterium]|nr:hypothetical protein [bacterium]
MRAGARRFMWVALVVALLAVAGVTACFVVGDRGAPSADTPRMSLDASAKAVEVPLGDPARWEAVEGTWTPRAGETGPVLAQTATDRVFPHILLKDTKLRDVDASVRFRPVSGREDASGGIVFRAADG